MKSIAISYFLVGILALSPYIKLHPIEEVKYKIINPLLLTFLEGKGDNIYEVDYFDQIEPKDLLKHGIIKVKLTKSIIANNELAEEALADNYVPKSPKARHSLFERTKVTKFTEVSYSDAKFRHETTDWMGMGPCKKSENNATGGFSTGWSVNANTGGQAALSIPLLLAAFVASESFTLTSSISGTLGGGVLCDIPPYGKLQFQMMAQTTTTTDVRTREVRVIKHPWSKAIIEVDNFKELDEWTEIDNQNIQVACVTDPQYMSCESK